MDFKPGCLFVVILAIVLMVGTGVAVEAIRIHVDCVQQSEDCPGAFDKS